MRSINLQQHHKEWLLYLFAVWGCHKKSYLDQMQTLDLGFLSFQNGENYIPVFYQLPRITNWLRRLPATNFICPFRWFRKALLYLLCSWRSGGSESYHIDLKSHSKSLNLGLTDCDIHKAKEVFSRDRHFLQSSEEWELGNAPNCGMYSDFVLHCPSGMICLQQLTTHGSQTWELSDPMPLLNISLCFRGKDSIL